MQRRVSTLLAAAGLAFVLAFGCGNGRPPPAGDGTVSPGAGSTSGNTFDIDAGSDKPPGCGTAPDGTFCECVDAPLFVDAPNMYFVLDRSGSMSEGDKWTQVRIVVGKIMRALGPRANFGAMIYPGNNTDTCAPGVEIVSTRPGDPPSTKDGPTTTALLTKSNVKPGGGTPTSASLAAAREIVRKLPGKTFVILATDGAPNCNTYATCGYDKCMPNIEDVQGCPKLGPFNCCAPPDGYRENCLDSDASASEARLLEQLGIPVYVIGLPGTAAYASVLDEIAVSGGTAGPTSPKYFAVNAASESEILGALKKVAAKIVATCEFSLKDEPSDPRLVNVYLDEVVLPYDPAATWKIEGKTITLLGDTCTKVMNGDVLDVRIIAGCPRVEPR